MVPLKAKKLQAKLCLDSDLTNKQKETLLKLLNHWKERGELETKLALIQTREWKAHVLCIARNHRVITKEEYDCECATRTFLSISEFNFLPNNQSFHEILPVTNLSQKEIDSLYHQNAGECYPGLLRVKCGVYGGNKAFLVVRIRTLDTEFDNAMIEVVGPNFKGELKCKDGAYYYEIRAFDIPREKLQQAKAELDEVAWDLLTFKEEKQGLGDNSTSDFLKLLKNPDYLHCCL